MATVSHSEAETFVSCEKKHFYSYGMQLQPKGGSIGDALYRGILGHLGFAAYYQAILERSSFPLSAGHGAIISQANQSGRNDPRIMAELIALFQKYHELYSDRDKDIEVVEVESSRLYEINPDLSTQIRPDLIVRVPGHGLQCWDNKFLYNFMSNAALELYPQLPKYYEGLQNAGLEIRSLWYNQVRYRDLKPDVKLSAQANLERIFRRTPLPVSFARRKSTMSDHLKIARRIAHYKSLPVEAWEEATIRARNKNCDNCAFNTLCINDQYGRPRELMIQEEYTPKKMREVIE